MTDLRAAGFGTPRMKAASFYTIGPNAAGVSATHLKAAAVCKTDRGIRRLQCDPAERSRLSTTDPTAACSSTARLEAAGFSVTDLKASGFNATPSVSGWW